MKALILDAENKTANLKSVLRPHPTPKELLIRVVAVALNPIDSLYVSNPLARTGRTIGSDFAGVVEDLGDAVPSLKPGDRVAGFLQGACSVNDRPGAFAEFLVCPWDLVWKVGGEMQLQEAAAMSLCGLTAAQALFYRMGLKAPFPWPSYVPATAAATEPDEKQHASKSPHTTQVSFFIYGASTSVGLYAAQLVRRSAETNGTSIKLFGATSSKHFQMLQAEPYGYDGLLDYHDPDWPSKVRRLTHAGKGVDYAYDCISEGWTVSKTASTLAPSGKMAVVRSREGGAWMEEGDCLPVTPSYGAVWEGLGEMIQYQGMDLPASPTARSFAVAFYEWLSNGHERLAPNPLREMPGGLESVVNDGFKLLGSGTMGDRGSSSDSACMKPLSAEKMVYTV